jgi:hypothetical protein
MDINVYCKRNSCKNKLRTGKVYCSWSCYKIDISSKPKLRKCQCCGKETNNKRYCSFDCFGKHFTQSEESKRKTGASNKKDWATRWKRSRIKEFTGHSFNKRASKWFEKYDKENNTHGQYAINSGDEEYFIERLGYWVDYINFEKKLIIEWDEQSHYLHNKLRDADISRQNKIKSLYTDFNFIRIREKKNGKIELPE